MPLINGQKMACEPCIRGHRSTKCTHANERLMVPVRKPGRPLSTCPHPPNRACGCGSVTAAIPRNQQCRCGSAHTTAEPASDNHEPVPVLAETPVSPTRPPFRVQKSGSISKQSIRKQSLDPSSFQRIDPNSVNVLNALTPVGPGNFPVGGNSLATPIHGPDVPINYPAPFPPEFTGQNLAEYKNGFPFVGGPQGLGPQSRTSIAVKQEVGSPQITNGHGIPSSVQPPIARNGTNGGSCCAPPPTTNEGSCCAPPPATNGGSCCSPPLTPKATRHTPSSSNGSISKPAAKPGSCCSPDNNENDVVEPKIDPVQGQRPQSASRSMLAGFPQPLVLNNPGFPAYVQQTVYTYPAPYGSYQFPLQPSQWPTTVSISAYGQPMTPGPVTVVHPSPLMTNGSSNGLGTSHMCTCGDSCNCIGCPAHPYNPATQEYVRSAWNIQMATGSIEPPVEVTNAVPHGQARSNADSASPTTALSPSDTSEEQTLSANDFFFVDYHGFTGECGGDTATCPCGDDCACLGCSIHNQNPATNE